MRSQSKITLSIPAEATNLQVGCKSSDMIDYLWPLRVLIRHGSSSLFILDFKLFIRIGRPLFFNAFKKRIFLSFMDPIMLLIR